MAILIIFSLSESNVENKSKALLTYMSFSLSRGNLKSILDSINLIIGRKRPYLAIIVNKINYHSFLYVFFLPDNADLKFEFTELIAQIDEVAQTCLRKTGISNHNKN